jgi:hypothetical protein
MRDFTLILSLLWTRGGGQIPFIIGGIMSVDLVCESNGESYIRDENPAPQITKVLNGREFQTWPTFLAKVLDRIQNAVKGSSNNYPIDDYNYSIGKCPRGHKAYHIYHQKSHPSIFLCEEKREWCPFEYYNFLAHLRGEL